MDKDDDLIVENVQCLRNLGEINLFDSTDLNKVVSGT